VYRNSSNQGENQNKDISNVAAEKGQKLQVLVKGPASKTTRIHAPPLDRSHIYTRKNLKVNYMILKPRERTRDTKAYVSARKD